MAMTKKDFIALADALRETLIKSADKNGCDLVDRNDVIDDIVSFCKAQNSNFKENRWREYLAGNCGPNGGQIK